MSVTQDSFSKKNVKWLIGDVRSFTGSVGMTFVEEFQVQHIPVTSARRILNDIYIETL